MSKLHGKMVSLGDMSKYHYEDIVAGCGKPKETVSCVFSDIGEGSRSTWSDGIFSITLNFDNNGKYCGIYAHRNLSPYIWLFVITATIIAAALIIGAKLRENAASDTLDAPSLEALLLENEEIWLDDTTAGICLLDLDFDGTPELLATDTEIVWYEELEMYYFGTSDVSVFSLTGGNLTPLGGYITDEYCFLATIHLFTDGGGNKGWYYTSGGEVYLLSVSDGAVATSIALQMPDISGGDEAIKLIRNECWVTNYGDNTDRTAAEADVRAIASEYFADK